jgi:hypothetical protein
VENIKHKDEKRKAELNRETIYGNSKQVPSFKVLFKITNLTA